MIRFNLCLLAIVAAVTSTSATTYYVATNGNDSNVGTKASPFLTVKRGIAAAGSPGDTVYLRGGQYNMGTGATGADQVLVQASGTAGNPITVSGFPGESAVVRWSAANTYARFVFAAPGGDTQPVGHRIFQNFEVWGMFWCNSANEPIFRNLLIHHGAIGIFGSMWKGTVDRCVIHFSNGHGMYVSGTYNTITNSLFYNNGRLLESGYPGTTSNNDGYGIQGAGYPFDGKHAGPQYQTWQNNLIANNTFAYNKKAGCTNWQIGANNNTFENNIFYQNGVGSPGGSTGIDWVSSGPGNIVRNNLFFSTSPRPTTDFSGGTAGTTYLVSGSIHASPLFVNAPATIPVSPDFHLLSTSPAKDAGFSELRITADFDGNVRPQGAGYDIGAYEYRAGAGFAETHVRDFSRLDAIKISLAGAGVRITNLNGKAVAWAKVFTLSGVELASFDNIGRQAATWNPGKAPAGVYLVKVESGSITQTARVFCGK